MYLDDLRTACQRRAVPDYDHALDAYLCAGTLNAGDRAVLDSLVETGTGAGNVLNYLRGRVGTTALQVAYIAYVDGIGGGPTPS